MTLATPSQIEEFLDRWLSFQECIIQSIEIRHRGTEVEIALDYIWEAGWTVRETPIRVPLRFRGIQEFRMYNALSPHRVAHLEEIGWGFDEIALARVDSDLLLDPDTNATFIRLFFLWEGRNAREIGISFKALEVRDEHAAGPEGSSSPAWP